MPHAGMCNWLLPRWGGNNGEGGALVGALAARYPSPHGELLYARTALALTPMLDTQGLQYEAGFSILRVLEAVDPLLNQGNPARYEVELLIALAQNSQRPELVQKLAEYHVQHFGMPSRHAYQQNAVRAIAAAKEAGLVNAREVKR